MLLKLQGIGQDQHATLNATLTHAYTGRLDDATAKDVPLMCQVGLGAALLPAVPAVPKQRLPAWPASAVVLCMTSMLLAC